MSVARSQRGCPTDATLEEVHIIRKVGFDWHQDTWDYRRRKRRPLYTFVVQVSPGHSAMQVLGASDVFDYEMPGDTAMFPSDCWHQSLPNDWGCDGSIFKVVFFVGSTTFCDFTDVLVPFDPVIPDEYKSSQAEAVAEATNELLRKAAEGSMS